MKRNRRYVEAFFVLSTAMAGLVSRVGGQEVKHPGHPWDYGKEHGPDHWGELKSEFAPCKAGHRQSPIDIDKTEKADLPAIQFDYHATALDIVDNGHSIQVSYAPGSSIRVGGHQYTLKQFHFHHPSEEAIHGTHHEMSLHLVHADGAGKLAVVAVVLDAGAGNALVGQLWSNLPKEEGKEVRKDAQINAADLLPPDRGYYTFEGSLTTPPCSENVTWLVLKEPMTLSKDQIATFSRRYANDARPVQPIYDRVVKETR